MLPAAEPEQGKNMNTDLLTTKELAIVDLGAAIARGEQDKLASALNRGFDAGLTLAEAKEFVGQLYAYCGFPRALNAAATLMEVWGTGNGERGIGNGNGRWETGKGPSPFKANYNALRDGTANQTKLCGAPVKGALFDFHPQLDEYLKAHLFGDIFARDNLDWRTREIITIAALAARPETMPQLKAHVAIGKKNGVTDEQAAAIVGRVAPGGSQFIATANGSDAMNCVPPADWSPIPVGEPNTAYAKYFIGRSYLHKLTLDQIPAFGVTFEPGCRNNWHIHHAKTGGGQMLIVTAGEGFYQEWGKPARRLKKGDTVNIPANVKHWHGAAPDSWFQHIALEVPGTEASNEWCEPVDDTAYAEATK
jgi:alkylhydroperoxidase/carboxymuconolactone decarboxylase family protein YurZ/quercetin dioxygenase-like cupin family protein